MMRLPQKLLTEVLKLEFVEIHELLPDTWLSSIEDEPTNCCLGATKEKKRKPVTNIFTWLQGFASLVSALSTKYPTMVPEFLAYQSTIVKCFKDLKGWAGPSKKAGCGNKGSQLVANRWHFIQPMLRWKSQKSALCTHCLSDGHST